MADTRARRARETQDQTGSNAFGFDSDQAFENLTGGMPQSFIDLFPSISSNAVLTAIWQAMGESEGLRPIRTAIEGGMALTEAQQQTLAEEAAKAETEARYQESREIIQAGGQLSANRLREFAQSFIARSEADREAALEDLGDTRGEVLGNLRGLAFVDDQAFSAFSDPLLEGFQERESSIFSELEGLGEADRARINRDAETERERQQAQLQSRGFSSSNLLANIGTGVERERLEAQGFLDEQLRRERIDIFSDVGRETLDAEERLGSLGFDIGSAGRARTGEAVNQFAFNAFDINRGFDTEQRAYTTATNERIGARLDRRDTELLELLRSRNDIPPDAMAFINRMMNLGATDAPEVDQPSFAEQNAGNFAAIGTSFIPGIGPFIAAPVGAAVDAGVNKGGGQGGTGGLGTGGQGGATSIARKRIR